MQIVTFSPDNPPNKAVKKQLTDFLADNLQQYGDEASAIEKAIDYALSTQQGKGGLLVIATNDSQVMTGAVVINHTGMSDYIPEHILVYIATHKDFRGKGIGKLLMKETMQATTGDIALHVEKDNPAIQLYEKYGFTAPYIEMRYKR